MSVKSLSLSKSPIAEGHVHANGMIDDETTLILADKHKIILPTDYITSTGRRKWSDYRHFHEAYDAGVALIKTPEDLNLVVKTYLTNAAESGAIYVDIFSSGMNNYRKKNGDAWPNFRDNTLATLQAMNEARVETGIESALATTFKRHLENPVAEAHALVTLTRQFKEAALDTTNRLNGFHMAGNERKTTCDQFAPVYLRSVEELGFLINGNHAGEVRPAEDVRQAIRLRGLTRVGHALSAIQDPLLMDEMRDRRIAIEIVPTSNEMLHGLNPKTHPIRQYFNHGIPVMLGSDDPGLFGITIIDEYKKAHDHYGFSQRELLVMTANTIRYGFAPMERKEYAMAKVVAFHDASGFDMPREIFDLRQPVDLKKAIENMEDARHSPTRTDRFAASDQRYLM